MGYELTSTEKKRIEGLIRDRLEHERERFLRTYQPIFRPHEQTIAMLEAIVANLAAGGYTVTIDRGNLSYEMSPSHPIHELFDSLLREQLGGLWNHRQWDMPYTYEVIDDKVKEQEAKAKELLRRWVESVEADAPSDEEQPRHDEGTKAEAMEELQQVIENLKQQQIAAEEVIAEDMEPERVDLGADQ